MYQHNACHILYEMLGKERRRTDTSRGSKLSGQACLCAPLVVADEAELAIVERLAQAQVQSPSPSPKEALGKSLSLN